MARRRMPKPMRAGFKKELSEALINFNQLLSEAGEYGDVTVQTVALGATLDRPIHLVYVRVEVIKEDLYFSGPDDNTSEEA